MAHKIPSDSFGVKHVIPHWAPYILAQLSGSTAVLIQSVPCEQKLYMLCMSVL